MDKTHLSRSFKSQAAMNLAAYPVRPERVWRSQAAMNEPRDRRLYEIERAMCRYLDPEERRALRREYLDLTEPEETR